MSRHSDKFVSFETPASWLDKTVVAHAAPSPADPAAGAPNFVMTREPIADADSLHTHAQRQLLAVAQRMKDFRLLESRDTECGGVPAVFARYTWMGYCGCLEQTATICERVTDEGRVAISLTTTMMAEAGDAMRVLLDGVLGSVRFETSRTQRVSGPPSAPPASDPQSTPLRPWNADAVPMPGLRMRR